MIEPGVQEMLGFRDYPIAVGEGRRAPRRVFCHNGVPAVTPQPQWDYQLVDFNPTLAELSGFSLLGVPQYRRGWYSTVAVNRANRIIFRNETARTMNVMLYVAAAQNFVFESTDKVDENAYWLAHYQVTVQGYPTGAAPQAGYAGVGTDANVFQVNPTLEAQHYWDGKTDERRSAREVAFAFLPPLAPGSSYVAEPNIWITEEPNNFAATVDTGTYTNGAMKFCLTAWSDLDNG